MRSLYGLFEHRRNWALKQLGERWGKYMHMRKIENQCCLLSVQEIGDVENWARSIEMDMRTIATALEYVYKGQLQPSTS